MFDMTNDSNLFQTQAELQAGGWYPVGDGHWKKGDAEMLPLYVGRMIYHYDHRAAGVSVNERNMQNAAVSVAATDDQKRDPAFSPAPQFYVASDAEKRRDARDWQIGFRDVTNPTNERTAIAAIVPAAGCGNTLPLVLPDDADTSYAKWAPLLLANVNSMALDFVARQKLQGQHMNWYVAEQLPLIAPEAYTQALGHATIGKFVRGEVLRLSYTASDLVAFARDLGYDGAPFAWDEEDRRHRMARLDALYFNLYGLSRDEAAYVLDTFPIVREQDETRWNRYRTKELVLGYMNALAAGDTNTVLAL
jgi:hypothetical protein